MPGLGPIPISSFTCGTFLCSHSWQRMVHVHGYSCHLPFTSYLSSLKHALSSMMCQLRDPKLTSANASISLKLCLCLLTLSCSENICPFAVCPYSTPMHMAARSSSVCGQSERTLYGNVSAFVRALHLSFPQALFFLLLSFFFFSSTGLFVAVGAVRSHQGEITDCALQLRTHCPLTSLVTLFVFSFLVLFPVIVESNI